MKRVQRVWIESMPFENRARELTLQGREAKAVFSISPQNELHKAIAKTAYAVKEDYGMGISHVD